MCRKFSLLSDAIMLTTKAVKPLVYNYIVKQIFITRVLLNKATYFHFKTDFILIMLSYFYSTIEHYKLSCLHS